MIRSLFILNNDGAIVIEKHYRGVTSRDICDFFWEAVCRCDHRKDMVPILTTPKYYLVSVLHNKLFFLAVLAQETSPLMVIELLHRVVDIFDTYLKEVTEMAIKENFTTIYQVLEEVMDNGFPFITEPNALTSLIAPPSMLGRMVTAMSGKSAVSDVLDGAATSQIPWRKSGVKYTQNEIYFDVTETIDVIIDSSAQMIACDCSGVVNCNCRLSGVPDLSLSFANPSCITDCAFHPCVRYSRYEREKLVSFVPPDGKFELMKYRVTKPGPKGMVESPVYCKPSMGWNGEGTNGRLNVMVKNSNGTSLRTTKRGKVPTMEELEVVIPLSQSILNADISVTHGKHVFDEVTKTCIWKVGKIPSDAHPVLSGKLIASPGTVAKGESVTVQLTFKVADASVSGLRIDKLNLTNERYKLYKGVHTVTRAGNYEIRA